MCSSWSVFCQDKECPIFCDGPLIRVSARLGHAFRALARDVFLLPPENRICPHRVTRYDCRETGRRGRLGNPVRVRSIHPVAVIAEVCCSWREPVIGNPLRRRNNRRRRPPSSETARARIPTMLVNLWDVSGTERVTGKSLGSVKYGRFISFLKRPHFCAVILFSNWPSPVS